MFLLGVVLFATNRPPWPLDIGTCVDISLPIPHTVGPCLAEAAVGLPEVAGEGAIWHLLIRAGLVITGVPATRPPPATSSPATPTTPATSRGGGGEVVLSPSWWLTLESTTRIVAY